MTPQTRFQELMGDEEAMDRKADMLERIAIAITAEEKPCMIDVETMTGRLLVLTWTIIMSCPECRAVADAIIKDLDAEEVKP